MEKNIFSLTFLVLATVVFAQPGFGQKERASKTHLSGLLPVESFESTPFPPEGWTKMTNFDGKGWRRGNVGAAVPGMKDGVIDAPPGGESFVALATWATGDADSLFTTDQQTDQWLITPQVTSIAVGDSLTFYLRYFLTFAENFDVLVSRTDADSVASFDTTLISLSFDSTSSNEWQKYTIPLDDFAGQDIYIAFREHVFSTFNQGDALFLDLVEVNSLVTRVAQGPSAPSRIELLQNYPNPFNPTTRITYSLPQEAAVTLKVYNLLGQVVSTLVDEEVQSAGLHAVQFVADELPNGVYYYQIEAGSFVEVKKMTLVR
ncbi:MAG: choice-of-anchor J domain-containing protein [bacterium]